MYRTGCIMYDEVSVGNPGKVPYCTEQDKIEPDCQHCNRPCVTNADRIRAMTDEELNELLVTAQYGEYPPWHRARCIRDWLKQEAKESET